MDDFQAFQKTLSTALVSTTRTATQLCAEDLGFHRSLDPSVAVSLDQQNARLLSLAERLLGNAASGSEVVGPKLEDADAVEGNWRGVVDVVDSLLERADTSLDEYTGIVKRLTPSKEQSPAPVRETRNKFKTQDLPKPQALFENTPNNYAVDTWRPLLTSKPHASVPFEKSLNKYKGEDGVEHFQHPYQAEIENYQYPPSVYTKADPIPYPPFESTTATLVDTPEALDAMLKELKNAKEIAIDLEHHDTRTYIGIVSLMQISTRNKDWIVDTLVPWRRKLECLNEVFADPNIIKVLHGAYMDIIWLQRDLGLYLVGLFDTHHASRALGYAGGSLAFLLQKFINFTAQKQYQTADWRIRPLPTELFDYARSDTHFLLYIYDNMRNELIDKSDFSNPEEDRVKRVMDKSKETALQTYENPVYDEAEGSGPMGWYRALYRNPNMFNKEQFAVFRAVHQWRDSVARQEDESTHYVMANHALFSVAREMPLEKPKLLSVAQPISPLVRLRADELVGTIARAKESGAHGPEMWQVFSKIVGSTHAQPLVAPPSSSVGLSTAFESLKRPQANVVAARSEQSSFWGSIFPSSLWQQRRPASTDTIRLALPLPPLTAEIFADPADAAAAKQKQQQEKKAVDPGARAEHAYVRPEDRKVKTMQDDVFIVKQLGGRKRKLEEVARGGGSDDADAAMAEAAEGQQTKKQAAAADEELDPMADKVAFPNAVHSEAKGQGIPFEQGLRATRNESKRERRAARKKEERRLKAEAEAEAEATSATTGSGEAMDEDNNGDESIEDNGDEDGGDEDGGVSLGEAEETPFDYASAPSMLQGQQQQGRGDRKKDKKGRKKAFNPYAKATDAPKGLPRAQKERAGRSATFKQ